ncbi:transglycosylase SLT domain-containing protein [Streptomyces sp. B8F3]|uniref:aggregation-promoting factor C-terminal-like domain-containing protein n=1 Tax=unclassified Streptomyces TaxID=2593676 RepID=UPI00325EAA45
MSRISVRGFAVASATAVTSVGAVVGVATGAEKGDDSTANVEATAADATLLADVPAGATAQVQTASLTEQADAQADAAHTDARKAAEEAARKSAAQAAEEKKEAAERKAAEEAAEKEREAAEAASRSAAESESASADAGDFAPQSSYSVADVQAMARQMVPADQYQCFSNIVDHESGWDYTATNPSSGAYGLMQALPGEKMASAGADWQTNPATQIEWGLSYMNDRYGSPCGGWEFWQANGWY